MLLWNLRYELVNDKMILFTYFSINGLLIYVLVFSQIIQNGINYQVNNVKRDKLNKTVLIS